MFPLLLTPPAGQFPWWLGAIAPAAPVAVGHIAGSDHAVAVIAGSDAAVATIAGTETDRP